MSDATQPRRGRQFTLRAIFALVTVAAVVLGLTVGFGARVEWTGKGTLVISAAALAVVVSTAWQWRLCANSRQGLWLALGHVLLCVYVPFVWLLFIEYPWSDYRLGWLTLWPILPGIFLGALIHPHQYEFAVMGVVTISLVAALYWLALRGRYGVLAATVIALAIEIPSAFLSYALFRF